MTRPDLDLVYDRLIAGERLKSGSKYERLAAIAFATLEGRSAVHDLRLRGASGVRHQIDVTLGEGRKRTLVECKDYDRKIGLGIVRDFFGVVEDVRADEAYVVTTVGFTRGAKSYADAKGIKLAMLRAARESDLEGRIQRIHITMVPASFDLMSTEWLADADDPESTQADEMSGQSIWTREATLIAPDGSGQTLQEFLTRGLDLRGAYEGEPGPRLGEHRFEEPHVLALPNGTRVRVHGLRWKGILSRGEFNFDVGYGIGGLVAELALLTASGEVLEVFSNRLIKSFQFEPNGVITGS